jgi:hypothetical protein
VRILTLLTLLAAALLSACSGSDESLSPGDGSIQAGGTGTTLWVAEDASQGGRAVPFENGTAVNVGSVDVELFIAPYPPTREGSIDLLVTDNATGGPTDDGTVDISFDMDMPHGTIKAQAVSSGGGHYLVPYLLVMPGTWQVNVTVSQADDVRSLAFIFKVD